MTHDDIRELVILVKASDHHAFKKLFNTYHQTIFNFLLFRSKDADVAEDLLQEVFFKVWKNRKSLDENQSIKNYLYTIADHIFLNYVRHASVVHKHEQQVNSKLFTDVDKPDFMLEEKESLTNLTRAIESLPEKTRIIFMMSRFEDLSYKEIASRLSLNIKTIEGHMTKALKELRKALLLIL